MQLNDLGKWKVFALESGTFKLDGGAMMGSVPKVLWEKTNKPDDLNRIKLSMRCLLVDDGINRVLIETGIGFKNPEKFLKIFDIDHSKYTLSNTLSESGYSHNDITHVIITHLHFDHSGGALHFEDKQLKPSFPNATYYISDSNWKAAINPNEREKVSYISSNYMQLELEKKLKKIPDNYKILDGIETYVVNGHTKGQQLVKISDSSETIVFCSDLIPLKSHLKLPWIMGYDLNAEITLSEKKKFLDQASAENWILFFYHDPDCVAVRVKKSEKYYEIIDEIRRS